MLILLLKFSHLKSRFKGEPIHTPFCHPPNYPPVLNFIRSTNLYTNYTTWKTYYLFIAIDLSCVFIDNANPAISDQWRSYETWWVMEYMQWMYKN